MTRDEAIKIVEVCNPTPYPRAFVQTLEALKLLRFDSKSDPVITLCGEDPDWNWWLAQPPAFKAAAVKQIRSRPVPDNGEGVIQKLVEACRGVPYLATAINETLEKAGLKIVEK